jgi:hypothetical protein
VILLGVVELVTVAGRIEVVAVAADDLVEAEILSRLSAAAPSSKAT